ncbi:MAG TPA: acyl carrier protein [Acetobacteraceae bacterium]|nr:acyl carrier protein [Acetobacteraceae bacterium]
MSHETGIAEPTRTAVTEWIIRYATAALDMRREDFSTSAHFDSYGLDSAEVVIMAGLLEEAFGIEINPEQFFTTPSVDGVVEALVAAGTVRAD